MHSPRNAMVALVLAAVLGAQDTAPEHWPAAAVSSHLAGHDAAEVAWAGWHLARAPQRASLPALRRALAQWRGEDSADGQLARLQLLDALYQLDARLPGEELLPHAVGLLRGPLLALAAKAPLQNTAYFQARFAAASETPDGEWWCCGTLLAAQCAPGFAAEALRRVQPLRRYTLRDSNAPTGFSCGIPGSVPRVPAGFPPAPWYVLTVDPSPSRDRPAVGVARHPGSTAFPSTTMPISVEVADAWRGWLRQMGGEAAGSVFSAHREDVFWAGLGDLRRRLLRERSAVERLVPAALRELRSRGALTQNERAAVHLRLEFRIDDQRSDRRRPLPDPEVLLRPRR